MRILLLQPADSPRRGPWTRQRWDFVVDLGRSSPFAAAAWEELLRCPLLRADSFRKGIADFKEIKEILAHGKGRLLDDEGIDWWTLQSLEVLPELEAMLFLQRIAAEIPRPAELWATRPGWPASALAAVLGLPLQAFGASFAARQAGNIKHYGRLLHHFSAAQLREIAFDKYDAAYKWRSRSAARMPPLSAPCILIPSAYTNVSRVAAAYADVVPDQPFLLVATRRSSTLFEPRANVHLRPLATYAGGDSSDVELQTILAKWDVLIAELKQIREFQILLSLGALDHFKKSVRNCLAVRNAWRRVLECEPVCGVLCGDDSNVYTRLPVLLASRRGLPTLDFHHGAMDGRYLVKELACDRYLAKDETERDYLLNVCGLPPDEVVVGAPPATALATGKRKPSRAGSSIVFFSEPYEIVGIRTEELYRELFPALCQLAHSTGHDVILKLHPFESATERSAMARAILSSEDSRCVRIVSEPLSDALLAQAWVGVTIESSAVIDCTSRGIPCFLCGWLAFSPYGYMQQYVKFGVGEILRKVEEVADIPRKLAEHAAPTGEHALPSKVIEPQQLLQWLGANAPEPALRRA